MSKTPVLVMVVTTVLLLMLACSSESGSDTSEELGSTGGTGTGGSAPTTGGTAAATGGAAASTGGMATGGMATGGIATGGTATGGIATGGTATGGIATGATGGIVTGGAAMGGSGNPDCNPESLPATTIYMIGDSTMSNKDIPNDKNERGWGQMLGQFFDESKATVANHARNGRSSRSFIDEGLWDEVEERLSTDDWLVIQFGHNDAKSDDRHTDPFTTYAANIRRFALAALDKGAHPIVCTSIMRGGDPDSHGDYPEAAIGVAQEMNVPLVDLETHTKEYVLSLADETEFYIERGNSHTNEAGALKVCELFVNDIQEQNLPLSCYLK